MSQTHDELNNARHLLQNAMNVANELLDTLEKENEDRTGYVKELAEKRIAIFDALMFSIEIFDATVVRYVQFNPPGDAYKYYKEKLHIAQKYITAIGGDFNSVLWGKKSDYQ